jgi:hypothetical protein
MQGGLLPIASTSLSESVPAKVALGGAVAMKRLRFTKQPIAFSPALPGLTFCAASSASMLKLTSGNGAIFVHTTARIAGDGPYEYDGGT